MPASVNAYVPQCVPAARSLRRPFLMWLVAVLSVLGVIGLVLLAPFCATHGYASAAQIIYQAFGPVCHQMAERSFQLEGYPHAVCARCFGLYTGFVAGGIGYPLVRSLNQTRVPARAWIIVAALPTAIDWALGWMGLWENTHFSRVATGALLGAASVFYVMPGLAELSWISWRSRFAPIFRGRMMRERGSNDETRRERAVSER